MLDPVYFLSPDGQLVFADAVGEIVASRLDDVLPALAEIDRHVAAGLCAAGFLAYEAAPAFDPAFPRRPISLTGLPLLSFRLFRSFTRQSLPASFPAESPGPSPSWSPSISPHDYHRAVEWIRQKIAAGETYQLNYTFPLSAHFSGDPLAWLYHLWPRQRAPYAGLYTTDDFAILSLSPELFFSLDGDRLETRPMKGTRPRGLWPQSDQALARELAASPKDLAENTMIVDLLRNDLGRISHTGSVRVDSPFAIEKYPTVWQMTSTIRSTTSASVPQVLAALFPCGSVTGAPKVRTMQLIHQLEPRPRGIYCGALGYWLPNRRATFNVAIRTLCIDRLRQTATYGVGSGITFDSQPAAEWQECLTKAAVLSPRPPFSLLESLRFDGGYFLLDEHLQRLQSSADYFGFPFDIAAIRHALDACAAKLPGPPAAFKVRLCLSPAGHLDIRSEPVPAPGILRLGIAASPIDPADVFLYHKTTHRAVYEAALRHRPLCQDVLLWNPSGHLTESTIANLALNCSGQWLTPPVSAGLLAGVFRRHLLDRGQLHEAPLTIDDLSHAHEIALINSVRRWIPVQLIR